MCAMAQETSRISSGEILTSDPVTAKNGTNGSLLLVSGATTGQRTVDLKLGDSLTSITDLTLEDAARKIREFEQANSMLRDYMKESNENVSRMYQSLKLYQANEKEKSDRTNAVIVALRQENQELQVKVHELNATVTKLRKSGDQEQPCGQDLRTNNQPSLASEDDKDKPENVAENQQAIVSELKSDLASKEECVKLLQADISKHKEEIRQHQESERQLLNELESQQKQKEVTDQENHQLNHQLVELNKKFHEQMQIQLTTTKRKLEAQQAVKSGEGGGGSFSQKVGCADSPKKSLHHLRHESIDELLERAQAHNEEAKFNDAETSKALLEKETAEKQKLEKVVKELMDKVQELSVQAGEARRAVAAVEQEKVEAINQLSRDYEAKLTEKAKQEVNQRQEPANTDDTEILKSQVISLFKEVSETNAKFSDAVQTIKHKDEKLEEQYRTITHQNNVFYDHQRRIQFLEMERSRQQHAYSELFLEKSQLQDSFYQLVTEVQNQKVEHEMSQQQQETEHRRLSSENSEELNRLTAEVFAAEEALALKDDQLAELKTKLRQQEEDNDIFRIQVETYRSDFTCERESRGKLAQERDEFSEALRRSQEEAQGLKEQLREAHQRHLMGWDQRLKAPSQETSPPVQGGQGATGGGEVAAPPSLPLRSSLAQHPSVSAGGQGLRMPQNTTQPSNAYYSQPQRQQPQNPAFLASVYGGGGGGGGGAALANLGYHHSPHTGMGNRFDGGIIPFQAKEHSENEFASLVQYDCPSCGLQLPDMDTLNLHVPDCMDDKQRE